MPDFFGSIVAPMIVAIPTAALTVGVYKIQERWEELVRIKKEQFEGFIAPAYQIVRDVSSGAIGYGIVEIKEKQPGDLASAVSRLMDLATNRRMLINDAMYLYIKSVDLDQPEEAKRRFAIIGKEVMRQYSVWKSTVEIKDNLPFREKAKVVNAAKMRGMFWYKAYVWTELVWPFVKFALAWSLMAVLGWVGFVWWWLSR